MEFNCVVCTSSGMIFYLKYDEKPGLKHNEKSGIIGYPHRMDGPAIIWPSGKKEYYINGKYFASKELFELYLRDKDLYNLLK